MVFNTGAALLDAIVLAVVSKEKDGTYGYKITQDVRSVLEVSESTLYPVLRRLQKDECLETYDQAFAGRNRPVRIFSPGVFISSSFTAARIASAGLDFPPAVSPSAALAACSTTGESMEFTVAVSEKLTSPTLFSPAYPSGCADSLSRVSIKALIPFFAASRADPSIFAERSIANTMS